MPLPFDGPPFLVDAVQVALRCAAVYVVLLLLLRLAGKRHSGQLSPHDFVVMLLIANALQSAMVGASVTLSGGLAGAVALIAVNLVLSRFILHHRRFGPLLAGTPTLLVRNGVVLHTNLEHERILPDELEAQLRAHGYDSVAQVKAAIQESDGSVSVIGFGAAQERQLPPVPTKHRKSKATAVTAR